MANIKLSDIKALENWDISNGKKFDGVFSGCSQSLNTKDLQNWKYI